MKQVLLISVLMSCLISCKKDATIALQKGLTGKWELRRVAGGIGGIDTSYPVDNGVTITFADNNQYTHTYANPGRPITTTGTYKLTKRTTCYNEEVTFIQFDTEPYSSILSVLDNTMDIADNSCIVSDGMVYEYERIE